MRRHLVALGLGALLAVAGCASPHVAAKASAAPSPTDAGSPSADATSTPAAPTPGASVTAHPTPTKTVASGAPSGRPSPTPSRRRRDYTITDNGKSAYSSALHPGDTVHMVFSECRSCGYHWALIQKPAPAVVRAGADSTTNPSHPSPSPSSTATPAPIVGGSGTHSWPFTGVGPGRTSATFGYFPPGSSVASRRVVLTFVVSP